MSKRKVKGPKGKTEKTESVTAKKKKSKYKGVRREGKKFSASYWDSVNKKLKYLGMFDSELLAAAAIQDEKGNKKEAKRLRNEYEKGNCRPEVTEPEDVHKRIFKKDESVSSGPGVRLED